MLRVQRLLLLAAGLGLLLLLLPLLMMLSSFERRVFAAVPVLKRRCISKFELVKASSAGKTACHDMPCCRQCVGVPTDFKLEPCRKMEGSIAELVSAAWMATTLLFEIVDWSKPLDMGVGSEPGMASRVHGIEKMVSCQNIERMHVSNTQHLWQTHEPTTSLIKLVVVHSS